MSHDRLLSLSMLFVSYGYSSIFILILIISYLYLYLTNDRNSSLKPRVLPADHHSPVSAAAKYWNETFPLTKSSQQDWDTGANHKGGFTS